MLAVSNNLFKTFSDTSKKFKRLQCNNDKTRIERLSLPAELAQPKNIDNISWHVKHDLTMTKTNNDDD